MFNDEWMRSKGFFDKKGLTAKDLVAFQKGKLISLDVKDSIDRAVKIMNENDFSQVAVTNEGRVVGSLNEQHLYSQIVKNPDVKSKSVETIMQPAFPYVDISAPIDSLSGMLTTENTAVLVRDFKTDETFIITRSDIIRALC
jgi:cystathionine beta-synthase